MDKPEILKRLRQDNEKWHALLDEIGTARMEMSGVNGAWSMKDIVAHMTGWNRKLAADLQAAVRGEPPPPPPWGAELVAEDDINAWIYETNRGRSLGEVLKEADAVNAQIYGLVEGLPDDVRTEFIEPHFYLVWVGETRFAPGEGFHHFVDDHEADVRAWMEREGIR